MFFDFFKDRKKVIDVRVDGERGYTEKKSAWLIAVVAVAVGILAFGDFGTDEAKEKKPSYETMFDEQRYMTEMETKLEEMLSTVKGAGKVNVMIMFEEKTEKVLASNKTNQKEAEDADGSKKEKSTTEEAVILFGSGSAEQPYVLKERLPVPKGIFVTATGASNESVKLELYGAVKALCGVSGHRVKISSAEK